MLGARAPQNTGAGGCKSNSSQRREESLWVNHLGGAASFASLQEMFPSIEGEQDMSAPICAILACEWASLRAQIVNNLPAMQDT